MPNLVNPYRFATAAPPAPVTNINPKYGLISYWAMDETSGDMLDSHGSNDGTTVSNVTRGGSDYAFNGSTSYVLIPDDDSLSATNNDMTIQGWMKTTTTTASFPLYKGSTSTNREYSIQTNTDGTVKGAMYNSGSSTAIAADSTTAANDNAWHFITVRIQGKYVHIFVDSVLEDVVDITTNSMGNLASGLNFGRYGGGSLYWSGSLKHWSFHRRGLSQAEIDWFYNSGTPRAYADLEWTGNSLKNGLTAYYKCDDVSGAITDSHNTYDSTSETAITYGATGKLGDAIEFNGSSSEVVYPSGLKTLMEGDFTIGFWTRLDTIPSGGNDGYLISDWTGTGGRNFLIRIKDSGKVGFLSGDGGSNADAEILSTTVLSTATWYHVTARRNGTNTTLFINGVNEASQTGTYSGGTTSNNLNSGKVDGFGAAYLDGRMDGIFFYDYAVDDDVVAQIYKAGTGQDYDDWTYGGRGLLYKLASYYKLDEASGTIQDEMLAIDSITESATYGATGVINDALDLNGTSDSIDFGATDHEYDGNSDPMSLSAWVNPDVISGTQVLCSNQQSSSPWDGWSVRINSSGDINFLFRANTGSNAIEVDTGVVISAAGGWYHVMATYDGSADASGMTIYVNETSESLGTVQNGLLGSTTTSGIFSIGSRNSADSFLNGQIDEIGLWSRELTAAENEGSNNEANGLSFDEFYGL